MKFLLFLQLLHAQLVLSPRYTNTLSTNFKLLVPSCPNSPAVGVSITAPVNLKFVGSNSQGWIMHYNHKTVGNQTYTSSISWSGNQIISPSTQTFEFEASFSKLSEGQQIIFTVYQQCTVKGSTVQELMTEYHSDLSMYQYGVVSSSTGIFSWLFVVIFMIS